MPRYFVDFQDGDTVQPDEEGSDLIGFEQARIEAIELLPQVARDELPDGEDRTFIVTVRDASHKALYRATLTFHGERLS